MADPGSLARQREQIGELPAAVAADFYISNDAIVPDDGVSCAECGYDLRGRRVADICPECGTSIRDTLREWIERLPLSDHPRWRRRVSIGLIGLGVLSIGTALLGLGERVEMAPRVVGLAHRALTLVLSIAWFVAAWLATMRGDPSPRGAERLRRAFRVAAVICLVTDVVLWSRPTTLLGARALFAWFEVIRYAAELLWAGTLFGYVLHLAHRLAARTMASQLPFVIIGAVLSLAFYRLIPWLADALIHMHLPAASMLLLFSRSVVPEMGYYGCLGWGGVILVLVGNGIAARRRKIRSAL